MLAGKDLEVIDLGTDVSSETFVNTVKNEGCHRRVLQKDWCRRLYPDTASASDKALELWLGQ